MRTKSGKIAPLAPGEGEVDLLDIVWHLGRTRRFGGWGNTEWTILHHTLTVGLIWNSMGYPRADIIYALMHDFHEAYIGDIPNPVKKALGKQGYAGVRVLEEQIDARIYAKLDLKPPDRETLRRVLICDLAALLIDTMSVSPTMVAEDCVRLEAVPPALQEEVGDAVALFAPQHANWFRQKWKVLAAITTRGNE